MRWFIGIDEVGRGALAGPLVVAGAGIRSDHYLAGELINASQTDFEFYIDASQKLVLRDSKKMTLKQRLAAADYLPALGIKFHLVAVKPHIIDTHGLSTVFGLAINKIIGLFQINNQADSITCLIDGRPPANFKPSKQANFKYIEDGDNSIGLIASAAVAAKVARDNLMRRLHQQYPVYGWNKNVGYGTLFHRQAIIKHGLCPYHRISFCQNLNIKTH